MNLSNMDDRNNVICDMYMNGQSLIDIGKTVGLSFGRVSRIVRNYGIPAHTTKIDLTGTRFKYLTAIKAVEKRTSKSGNSSSMWLCVCDCGNERIVSLGALRSDRVTSCGCKNTPRELRKRTHGHSCKGKVTAEFKLFLAAKSRAKKLGLPFTIEVTDITIPEHCPVFPYLELKVNKKHCADNSPSLDRIVPSKGYVKGNIVVISHKANTIKQNCTSKELRDVANWLEQIELNH